MIIENVKGQICYWGIRMNKVNKNLGVILLLGLLLVLSSCESPEDKQLRELSAIADKNINELQKDIDNFPSEFVSMDCKNNCDSWGRENEAGEEGIDKCYEWCVQRCGDKLGCAEDFVKGMGIVS